MKWGWNFFLSIPSVHSNLQWNKCWCFILPLLFLPIELGYKIGTFPRVFYWNQYPKQTGLCSISTTQNSVPIQCKHPGKPLVKQDCIPVGCVPPACWPYPSMHCAEGVWMPACTGWGVYISACTGRGVSAQGCLTGGCVYPGCVCVADPTPLP